jgi:hypothetical protein
MWLLTPGPPCERVLAVVGDRSWGVVSLLPRTLAVDTHDPPYEQVLIGMEWVLCCSASSGPSRHRLLAPMVHPTGRCWSSLAGSGCRCVVMEVVPGMVAFGALARHGRRTRVGVRTGRVPTTWRLPIGAIVPPPRPLSIVVCHSRCVGGWVECSFYNRIIAAKRQSRTIS